MKHLFVMIFALTATICSRAQLPDSGSINNNINLDKFVGTWKWSDNNGSEVTVIFKKVLYLWRWGFYEDILMGSHKYVKNGIVVEDNTGSFPNIGQNLKGSLLLWGKLNGSYPNEIHGNLRDLSKNKSESLDITYDGTGAIPQFKWDLSVGETVTIVGVTTSDPKTTLPGDMILIKQ